MLSVACAPPRLSVAAQQLLDDRVASATAEVVYVGDVTSVASPRDGVLFQYERRVEDYNISHLTRTLEGASVVWQGVRVDADGAFAEMELIHAQLGLVARATLEDESVTLTTSVGDGPEEVSVLVAQGDVVVGPTLFQYLLRRRDALDEGLAFDFLSLENRGLFRFVATATGAPGVFVVRAEDPFVGLFVGELTVVYDEATEQMISYQGPVPPVLDNGSTFEGLVRYRADGPFR